MDYKVSFWIISVYWICIWCRYKQWVLAACSRTNNGGGLQTMVNANEGRHERMQMRVGKQWWERSWHVAAAPLAAATITVPHPSTHYPKTSPPTSCWPKPSSHGLVFVFFISPNHPLSHATEFHHPATSHLMYTSFGFPLPKYPPTCIQLAKNKPPRLDFGFLALIGPYSHATESDPKGMQTGKHTWMTMSKRKWEQASANKGGGAMAAAAAIIRVLLFYLFI